MIEMELVNPLNTQSKCNRDGVCFLGEVEDLITYAALTSHFQVTQGRVLVDSNYTDKWLRFTIDDKELYVAKGPINNYITWTHLYSKGLVYGVNNNGSNPLSPPVNQLRTITIDNKTYKCRLLKTAPEPGDTYVGSNLTYDSQGTHNSEWNRLFYPIVIDDNNIVSYTGAKLAKYTSTQLGQLNGACPLSWCQESVSSDLTQRVLRGNPASFLAWNSPGFDYSLYGWRPVLELIQ